MLKKYNFTMVVLVVNLLACSSYPTLINNKSIVDTTIDGAQIISLEQMRNSTESYSWFDFKPGVKKLILSGTPDSKHVSILWYWYQDQPGKVPLHFHSKTESIYVIDGVQSDEKGSYSRGSFYFNPPQSGHSIFDSRGLFVLAYASPPDFKRTEEIEQYQMEYIDPDYNKLIFKPCDFFVGAECSVIPLAKTGGMRSGFIKMSNLKNVPVAANYLLSLQGDCSVNSLIAPQDHMIVTSSPEPMVYNLANKGANACLMFYLVFE